MSKTHKRKGEYIMKSEKMQGIYRIHNKVNGKSYVGRSSDISKGFEEHAYDLNKGKHSNYKLQRDWIKYGIHSFEFVTLLEMHNMAISRFVEKDFFLTFSKTGVYNLSDPMNEWNEHLDGVLPTNIQTNANKGQEMWIRLNNRLLTLGDGLHLTMEELYIYSFVYLTRDFDGDCKVSLSTLYDLMKIKFSSRKSRAISAIKKSLISMTEKGVLNTYTLEGECAPFEKISANVTLNIKLQIIEENGYTKLRKEELEFFDNLSDYYIYSLAKRWANSKERMFKCDYDTLSKILNISKTTAFTYVDRAVKNKVVKKVSGKFTGIGLKQEINGYKALPLFNARDEAI